MVIGRNERDHSDQGWPFFFYKASENKHVSFCGQCGLSEIFNFGIIA